MQNMLVDKENNKGWVKFGLTANSVVSVGFIKFLKIPMPFYVNKAFPICFRNCF